MVKATGKVLRRMGDAVRAALRDERGGEVLEYALILGLIVVAAMAVIASVGSKVLANWNGLNN